MIVPRCAVAGLLALTTSTGIASGQPFQTLPAEITEEPHAEFGNVAETSNTGTAAAANTSTSTNTIGQGGDDGRPGTFQFLGGGGVGEDEDEDDSATSARSRSEMLLEPEPTQPEAVPPEEEGAVTVPKKSQQGGVDGVEAAVVSNVAAPPAALNTDANPTIAPTRQPSATPTLPLVEHVSEALILDAAYVSENYPDRNYDAKSSGFALINQEPRLDALLRFELPEDVFAGGNEGDGSIPHITEAILEVSTVTGVDPVGAWVYQSTYNEWTATDVTWNSLFGDYEYKVSGTIVSTDIEGQSMAIITDIVPIDGKYIVLRLVAGRDDDYSALHQDAKLILKYLVKDKKEAPKSQETTTEQVSDQDLLDAIDSELEEIEQIEKIVDSGELSEDISIDGNVKLCNTKEEKQCREKCIQDRECDSDDVLSSCHGRCREKCCAYGDDNESEVEEAYVGVDDMEDYIEGDDMEDVNEAEEEVVEETEEESPSSDGYSRHQYTFPIQEEGVPCEDFNRRNPEGVYYVKIPKTDTYYWSSIAYRSLQTGRECFVHAEHEDAYSLNLRSRNDEKSFMFTFVRNPKDYILKSFFYFKVTKNGERPTAGAVEEYSRDYGNKQSSMMMGLANENAYKRKGLKRPSSIAKAIVAEYDFIGLVEKPDESLVLMQLLLGLDTEDILYNPSPHAGTISLWKDNKDVCEEVQKEYVPNGAQGYFDSNEFYDHNDIDIEIHQEVERVHEATIEKIGRDKFNEALRIYRSEMMVVEKQCLPTVEYKCNEAGKRWKDLNNCDKNGCDAKCLSSLKL